MINRKMQLLNLISLISGTTTAASQIPFNLPPSLPVRPNTFIPFALAATAAYIIFSEFPDVVIPRNTSPLLSKTCNLLGIYHFPVHIV